MNMKKWMEQIQAEKVKKPLPILAFPCVQLMGITGESESRRRTERYRPRE